MMVGDLDTMASPVGGQNWRMAITIRVHCNKDYPVVGALVTGSWSEDVGGESSCMTSAAGTCVIATGRMDSIAIPSVSFTITDVSQSSYRYSPTENHDTEGDSDGTTITVHYSELVSR